jgi:hypothetical protein
MQGQISVSPCGLSVAYISSNDHSAYHNELHLHLSSIQIGVLLIARANTVEFEEPTALFHFGHDPIKIFTWATSESVITVTEDGILRKWSTDEVRASRQALV